MLREESWRKHLPEQVQTSWWTSRRVFPCGHRFFQPFLGQSPAEEWNAPSLWHPDPGQPGTLHTPEPRRKHPQPESCQGSKAGRRGHHWKEKKCKWQGSSNTSLFVLANTRADKFSLLCLFISPCNAEFFISRDTQISGPFSCCQDKSLCCVIGYLSFSVSCLLMKTQLRETFSYALREKLCNPLLNYCGYV